MADGAVRVAGDLALDLLNTVMGEDDEQIDMLQSDADVRRWLRESGLPSATEEPVREGRLLRAAQELREGIRVAVEAWTHGRRVEVEGINRFLSRRRTRVTLVAPKGKALAMEEATDARDEIELLAPVAMAAARLLVEGKVELVRQCEGDGCVLWFRDATKSHRRRWCSMATCGNRHKVGVFRERRG